MEWIVPGCLIIIVYAMYVVDKRLTKIIDLLHDIKKGYRD